MGSKFKKPSNKNNTQLINPPIKSNEEIQSEFVKFSFRYLVTDNELFTITGRSSDYFIKAIERLQVVCQMTCAELKYPTRQALRNHFIDWEDTSQSGFGIPNEEQLVDRPFQFGISANEHGRLIGFFIGNVYYVVWFDPDHNTYS